MPLLYDHPASGNCLKVRLLLAHLGTRYERVHVDIFAGRDPALVGRNPAGRVPVWEEDDGWALPESAAILLHLARGSSWLPDEPRAAARVHQWLGFEQNLLEPNVGTGRFWALTGLAERRPQVQERFREAGAAAVAVVERGLEGRSWLAGEGPTIADLALYAYTHVAPDVGLSLGSATREWIARVEALPGHVNDLAPYPPEAMAGVSRRAD